MSYRFDIEAPTPICIALAICTNPWFLAEFGARVLEVSPAGDEGDAMSYSIEFPDESACNGWKWLVIVRLWDVCERVGWHYEPKLAAEYLQAWWPNRDVIVDESFEPVEWGREESEIEDRGSGDGD